MLQCGTPFLPLLLLFLGLDPSVGMSPSNCYFTCLSGKTLSKTHRLPHNLHSTETGLKLLQMGGFKDGRAGPFGRNLSDPAAIGAFSQGSLSRCCVSLFTKVSRLLSELCSAQRHKWKNQEQPGAFLSCCCGRRENRL